MSMLFEKAGPLVERPPATAMYGLAQDNGSVGTAQIGPLIDRDFSSPRLTSIVVRVCLGIWAVVGLVFWFPILIRETARFSFALGRAMLQGTRPTREGKVLSEAVSFYGQGFRVARRAIAGGAPGPQKKQKPTPPGTGRVVSELLWAGVVWYGILFVIGAVEVNPVDGWRAVFDLPWAEWVGAAEEQLLRF